MEKRTIHEICEWAYVVLTDPDMDLVFTWNGSATFSVYQGPELRECDGWMTDVVPASPSEARERCRGRLETLRAEEASAMTLEEIESFQKGDQ